MGFLDNMAKNAFEKEDIQKSWQVHMQAFGPILEPAFVRDYSARIHLTAALNRISRGDIQGGLKKLQPLRKSCKTDADFAALEFVLGLSLEQAGEIRHALGFYQHANSRNHRFYLPYLKIAKYAYEDMAYETSERNYRKAISCFDGTGLGEQEKMLLGSAYTNLASCLTMMHQFDEAHQSLKTSRQIVPDAAGRLGTEAILYAAEGNQAQAQQCLAELEQVLPDSAAMVREVVSPILAGKNAHFTLICPDQEKIGIFWNWFLEKETEMLARMESGDGENALGEISKRLHAVFTYLERPPFVGFEKTETTNRLLLPDGYSTSLEYGYQQLLSQIPQNLQAAWDFSHEH